MTSIAQHWIGGEWVVSNRVSESTNPATGETLGQWYDGGEAEARAAVARPSPPQRGPATGRSATAPSHRWPSGSTPTNTNLGRS